jgi:hemolysin activation/secretion protein
MAFSFLRATLPFIGLSGLILSSMACYAYGQSDIDSSQNAGGEIFSEKGGAGEEAGVVVEEQQEAPKFDIWEFRVKGNTLLDARDIELAVYRHLGPQKRLTDIEEAADALERKYRDKGYPAVYVDIPEQDVVGGVVYLEATEGKISRVRVTDSDYFALTEIKDGIPAATEGEVLHLPSFQQDLNKLNTLSSDLSIVPILKQGNTPGTMDIDLKVKDKFPLHGEVSLNDYYSSNTSKTRVSANIRYDNLWQKQHSFGFHVQSTPEDTDEIKVFSGTYVMPWKDTSNRMAFYAVKSESEIATLGGGNGLLVVGDSNIYGFRFIAPLKSSPRYLHSLTLGVDYKDVEELVGFDDPDLQGITTPLSYTVWSAKYNATTRSATATTRYGVGVNFGLTDFGNRIEEFEDKRFKGDPDFIYLLASMSQQRYFEDDWQLKTAFRMQLTESPLVSNEQFSAGGHSSVRGYHESQKVADIGFLAGLELKTPSLLNNKFEFINEFRGLVFLEGAQLKIIDPLPDQDDRFTLSSVGIGMRMSAIDNLDLSLDWAYPLSNDCGDDCGADEGDIKKGDSRFTFDFSYKF